MALRFPHTIKSVTDEEDAVIKKYYKDYIRPFVRVGPAGFLAMAGYADHAEDIYNMQVRSDDIWVTSFSRSGTTWLQELVWLVANDLDFEAAKNHPLTRRYAFLEYPTQASEKSKPPPTSSRQATVDDFRTLPGLPSPRFVKSHLPLSLLPPTLLDTAKVFYIARDARDVSVSFHFAHKLFRYFDDDVTIKEFWDLFKKDLNGSCAESLFILIMTLMVGINKKKEVRKVALCMRIRTRVMHTPLFPHVKDAWERRAHPNLMFLFYEELQQDLPAAIDKVSAFLGKEYSADQKQRLAEHLSFSNMKKTEFSKDKNVEKTFFRKGQSGGWLQYFDEDMKKEAEEYISHHLSQTSMRFPGPN